MITEQSNQFFHVDFDETEPYHYTECGLDNIFLLSGCEKISLNGEISTSIHDIDDLHDCILETLARKKSILTPKEIRFVRREMHLTQTQLGNLVGSNGQCVGRWEKLSGKPTDIPTANDLLIKLMVLDHLTGAAPFEVLKEMTELDEGSSLSQSKLSAFNDNKDFWKPERIAA